jgi:hypothetical protein
VFVALVAPTACSEGDDTPATDGATTTAEAAATTTSVTTPVTFTGAADSPFCNLLRGVDTSTVLAGDSGDPAAVEAGFHRLVGVLRDALALAPPEIDGDLSLVTEGIEALDATLAAAGYDFAALAASGESARISNAVNDPSFTAAGARLTAYRTQVCRL